MSPNRSTQVRESVPDRVVDMLRRIMGVIWATAATAVALIVAGSPLVAFDQPFRSIAAVLVAVAAAVMVVRAIVPRLTVWRGWTLQLIGGVSTAAFVMSLFSAQDLGGFTVARVGWSLLLLTIAAVAYLHWLGERAFLR